MPKKRKQTLPLSTQTATITGLSHDGRGIAHIEGKTTFISGTLPEEQVSFIYTQRHGRFDEGKLQEVISAHPDRTTPRCPHFGVCGGCSLQHLNTQAQIQHKQKILLEQLQHFGQVQPEHLLPPLTATPWGYRRKARLGIRYVDKKQKLLIGFREQNSRYLADLETCEILDPRIGHTIPALRDMLLKLTQYREIPQVEIAGGDKELSLIFRHLKPLTDTDHQHLAHYGETHGFSIYLQPAGPDSIHKIYPADDNDLMTYQLTEFGLEFQFKPTDFTQVNSTMNQRMVDLALKLMAPSSDDVILDLFCGLGNFSLPLAQKAARVIGVEGEARMVERAQRNATHNHLSNTAFYAADLTQDLPDHLGQAAWLSADINKILLDPPRSGAQEIIQHFAKLMVKHIVYVSCNPATLARDAGILVHQQGYRLTQVGVMDMFPHTSHVEAIAVFEK